MKWSFCRQKVLGGEGRRHKEASLHGVWNGTVCGAVNSYLKPAVAREARGGSLRREAPLNVQEVSAKPEPTRRLLWHGPRLSTRH